MRRCTRSSSKARGREGTRRARGVTVLAAAIALAAATPIAAAAAEPARLKVTIDAAVLKREASAGNAGAVLQAAAAAALAGLDPSSAPFVRELTDLYEHSPAREARFDVLRQRAFNGDVSAVLETQKTLELAGNGDAKMSAFVDELTELYEKGPGRASWEAAMKQRAAAGDVKVVLDAARASALATGDPNGSALVRTLTAYFLKSRGSRPPGPGADPSGDHSGASGSSAGSSDQSGGRRDPGEGLPEHNPSSGGSSPSSGSSPSGTGGQPNVTVRCTESNSNVGHGVTQSAYEVTSTDPTTKTKTVTTTSYDAYGDVVSQTTAVTTGDGETTTTDTTEEAKQQQSGASAGDDDELTTGDETSSAPDPTALERPTQLDMLGHPTNNPEDSGGANPEDANFDGRADTVGGHLDGRIDPSPEGTTVFFLGGDPAVHAYNTAGPETLPAGVADPQGTGPLSPDLANGPIENPRP